MKNYNLNVRLKSGTSFSLRVASSDLDEVTAWLGSLGSVAQHQVVGAPPVASYQPRTGERIAAARLARNMTQQELADAVGVAQQHIQRWEAGFCHPRTATLKRIGDALGVDWATLLRD